MKAEFVQRIDLHNRTALETVIPLDTPLVLFLDPVTRATSNVNFVRLLIEN